jgi:Rps23 Pro-64 3,4-dihydroxylase Tpa1-like proline 4-hydroxylase
MMDFSSFTRNGPWSWFMSDALLDRSRLDELVRHFPEEQLVLFERKEGSDKTYLCKQYQMYSQYADGGDGFVPHPAWRELLDYVRSPVYRESISRLTGCDLSQAGIEVIVNQYEQECYMSPHTDRRPKLITHLVYLSGERGADYGGEFVVHDGDGQAAHMVEAVAGRSVVFQRSGESLHSVNTVRTAHKRRSLQVVFWEYEPAAALPGRTVHGS